MILAMSLGAHTCCTSISLSLQIYAVGHHIDPAERSGVDGLEIGARCLPDRRTHCAPAAQATPVLICNTFARILTNRS